MFTRCDIQDDAICHTSIFVVVKINVDYQIVGSFATQDETTRTITEALEILANQNEN